MRWFAPNHFTFTYQQHRHPKLTPKQLPPFQGVTTPLSLRRGAGGEALFPFLRFAEGLGVRLKIAGISALFGGDELTRSLG